MKEQHGVGERPESESDCLVYLYVVSGRKFVTRFVQLNAYWVPDVSSVVQSVHTGAITQFANGLEKKEANLK